MLIILALSVGELFLTHVVDCIYLGLIGESVYCAVGDSVNCRQTTI